VVQTELDEMAEDPDESLSDVAKSFYRYSAFSESDLVEQLKFEGLNLV
jgi:isochorismate hydrolase